MKETLLVVGAIALIFWVGYMRGEDAEAYRHDQAVKEMEFRLAVVTANLKKAQRALKDKTHDDVATIRSTPDSTGCSKRTAPPAILDSVR